MAGGGRGRPRTARRRRRRRRRLLTPFLAPPFTRARAAPWCGHCKRLAPTWDQLATEVAAENSAAHVGKVDCTVHKSICERFEVRGYPTLLGFKDGATGSSTDAIKYPGGRDLASLKGWLTSNTPSAAAAADL